MSLSAHPNLGTVALPPGPAYRTGMRTPPCVLALLAGLLVMACSLEAQSLGELARKERNRKKASAGEGKVLSNEEVQQSRVADYPAAQARFAMPKGWDTPTANRNVVVSPCPGAALPRLPYEVETTTCVIAVGSDGPVRSYREDAAAGLQRVQAEFLAKTKQQLEPWRNFQLAGMPASETVVEMDKPTKRRLRMVIAVHGQTGLVYMMALIATEDQFPAFKESLDTVIVSFEPVPRARPVPAN